MCIVIYEKVVLLEISKNSLLTRVRGLQSTSCNANSQTNFLKLFQKFRQGSRKSSVFEFLFSKLQAYKLQPSVLQVFKILKNSGNSVYYGVPFSRSRRKKVFRKACKCTSKGLQHGCSTEKLLIHIFETAIFKKVSMHTEISLNIKTSLNIKKPLNKKILLNIKISVNIKKSLNIKISLNIKKPLNIKQSLDIKISLNTKISLNVKKSLNIKKVPEYKYFTKYKKVS